MLLAAPMEHNWTPGTRTPAPGAALRVPRLLREA